jgi:hypothetical protein
VVEVRQRTLWIAGRSWTRRTRRTTRRRRRGDEEERRGEEEQATDIKSNNPHLAGGEKQVIQYIPTINLIKFTESTLLCMCIYI